MWTKNKTLGKRKPCLDEEVSKEEKHSSEPSSEDDLEDPDLTDDEEDLSGLTELLEELERSVDSLRKNLQQPSSPLELQSQLLVSLSQIFMLLLREGPMSMKELVPKSMPKALSSEEPSKRMVKQLLPTYISESSPTGLGIAMEQEPSLSDSSSLTQHMQSTPPLTPTSESSDKSCSTNTSCLRPFRARQLQRPSWHQQGNTGGTSNGR